MRNRGFSSEFYAGVKKPPNLSSGGLVLDCFDQGLLADSAPNKTANYKFAVRAICLIVIKQQPRQAS